MEKNFAFFKDREGRAAFISFTFDSEIKKSKKIIDVGCDNNSLKKIIGPKVLGVDLFGAPDIKIDFEKDKLSRFKSGEFDMAVCTEVLEHLDNFHPMVDELFRVSRRYVLISLPNCLSLFAKINIVFQTKIGKFYGLPLKPPQDRHRWLFSYKDIDAFFQHYAKIHNYSIKKKFLQCTFSDTLKGRMVRFFVRNFSIDSACQSCWVLIQK